MENFFAPLRVKHHVHWKAIFEGLKTNMSSFALEGGIKTEKSPLPHVFDCKIRLEYRTMMPFVSTDRYDPNNAFKHVC